MSRSLADSRPPTIRSERSPEAFGRPLDGIGTAPFLGQVVIHESSTGRLFQLNETASQIWRSLCAGDREEAIVGDLAQARGADPAAVRRDVETFVEALQRAGLLGPREAVEHTHATEAHPPRGTPALDAAYRVADATVRVCCYPAEVAEGFRPLAAPAMMPDGTAAQACVTLFRHRGAFVLTCDGRFIERLDTPPAARWALVRQMVSAAGRRHWLALLHAGAIALPRGCLLLCGDSGAGKSTLLAALVHAGFPFLADDIVPLEQATGLAWPVRLAISIKENSWGPVGALFPQLAGAPIVRFGKRTMRYLWPGEGATAAGMTGYPATVALFPRYVKGAPPTLTRLDPGRSLALLGEGGSVLPSTDTGLAEFLARWSQIPAYHLSYDRLDEAVQAVRGLLQTLPGSLDGTATAAVARLQDGRLNSG